MAEQKPRLVRNVKTGEVLLEISGVGRIALKDKRKGYTGEISAVLKKNKHEETIGSMSYNVVEKGAANGSDYIGVYSIDVKSKLQNKGIASSMLRFLENKSKGKTITILESHNPAILRVFQKFGYARERDIDGFHGVKKIGETKARYRRRLK